MNKKKTTAPASKTLSSSKSSGGGPATIAEQRSASEQQLRTYEQAVQFFQQQKFAEARDRFLATTQGPAPHISDKARSYVQICERKMTKVEVDLRTADDHFNYGVERLNARHVEEAKFHLSRALSMQPNGEHILYILALCCGLGGDADSACENLKRAIEIEPRNRILARQDPEFLALAQQFPALRALLNSDIKATF
jgi:tetratricopeptide (TPR) repeat protein